ncbi:hypothetical protein ACFQ0B_29785 [Nonomuraea thailandensis]
MTTLLNAPPRVITVGAGLLDEALRAQAVATAPVAWRPPLPGTADALARVLADPRRKEANELAVRRLTSARPHLVGCGAPPSCSTGTRSCTRARPSPGSAPRARCVAR